jgi:hypothetical protein
MDRKEFQQLAVRTESVVDEMVMSERDFHVFLETLRAFVSLTEVLDIYKKHIFYSRPIDGNKQLNELMDASNFVERALSNVTAQVDETQVKVDINPRVFHALLGTITEHGEIAIALEKGLETGILDLVNICEELGDSDWYKALFYEVTGIEWEVVQKMIIKKLEIRFRDKIFKEGEANERDLEAERALMENMIKEQIDLFENNG